MSVANRLTHEPWRSPKTTGAVRTRSFFTKKEMPKKLLILDQELIREFIRDRRDRAADRYDEVWEGVYIAPPLATNSHQAVVLALAAMMFNVVTLEGRGRVYAGANVSVACRECTEGEKKCEQRENDPFHGDLLSEFYEGLRRCQRIVS